MTITATDLQHLSPERRQEWLRAHSRVTTRLPGSMPSITKPSHTPSLLELLGINPFKDTCALLRHAFYLERRESEARRRGVKVAKRVAEGH